MSEFYKKNKHLFEDDEVSKQQLCMQITNMIKGNSLLKTPLSSQQHGFQ